MSNIYFSSDFHGFHKNICKGSTSWESEASQNNGQRCRNFDNQYEMTEKLIQNINKTVKEDDILYYLGDWSFGGYDKIWQLRKQINCLNIHFILGNHDHHIENNKEVAIPKSEEEILKKLGFTEGMVNEDEESHWIKLQDLFKSVQHYKHISIHGQEIILCHYAMRVWNRSHTGSIHLYGHSHGSLENIPYGKSMDVGIDSAYRILGEYRPFKLEEVRSIMNKRDTLIIDHHNQNTN